LWGTVKNRPTMNDKKLLRALRYYYKTKVLRKVGLRKNIYNCIYFPIDRSRKDWINYNLYSPCNKSTLPYLTLLAFLFFNVRWFISHNISNHLLYSLHVLFLRLII
jgi:hypothetical protein